MVVATCWVLTWPWLCGWLYYYDAEQVIHWVWNSGLIPMFKNIFHHHFSYFKACFHVKGSTWFYIGILRIMTVLDLFHKHKADSKVLKPLVNNTLTGVSLSICQITPQRRPTSWWRPGWELCLSLRASTLSWTSKYTRLQKIHWVCNTVKTQGLTNTFCVRYLFLCCYIHMLICLKPTFEWSYHILRILFESFL